MHTVNVCTKRQDGGRDGVSVWLSWGQAGRGRQAHQEHVLGAALAVAEDGQLVIALQHFLLQEGQAIRKLDVMDVSK